jgi:hypothetical protein
MAASDNGANRRMHVVVSTVARGEHAKLANADSNGIF